MNTEEFNKSESKFIANLILERLDFFDRENNEHITIPKKYCQTISNIEKLEKSRSLEVLDHKYTYGRKENSEKIGLWSVPRMSAMVMAELINIMNSKIIVEVGTSAGYSTLFLSAGAIQTGGKVYTIELLKEKIELAKTNFQTAGAKNITLIEGEASKVLSGWDNKAKIDFAFLDADKENYGRYLDLLLPNMNIGGILVADNINDYGHMMEDYLQKVSGTHLPQSRCDKRVVSTYIAQLDNGLMITKKIKDYYEPAEKKGMSENLIDNG